MKKSLRLTRRFISLAMAVTLCAGLGACQGSPGGTKPGDPANSNSSQKPAGSSQAEPDPVEISLWTYPIGNWSNSATIASLLAGFNKQYPHIRVSVNYLDYNTGDSLIEEAIAGGRAPDIVFEGPERLCANWGARVASAASKPFMRGIRISIRMASYHPCAEAWNFSTAPSCPIPSGICCCPCPTAPWTSP